MRRATRKLWVFNSGDWLKIGTSVACRALRKVGSLVGSRWDSRLEGSKSHRKPQKIAAYAHVEWAC